MKRTASWFLREVRKAIKADPSKPVRFDVAESEMQAVNAAYRKLIFDGGKLIPWMMGKTEPPPPPPRHIRENEPLQRKAVSPNPSCFLRVAFLGPNVYTPAKIIRGTPAKRYKGPQEAMEAWSARLDELRTEYIPDFHVEGRYKVTVRPGDDRMDYEVWRGEDWLARRYCTLYSAEIVRLLESGDGNKYAVELMRPAYDAHRKWTSQRAAGSIAGGEARAKATVPEIVQAFRDYKRDFPRDNYQMAEGGVADQLGYKSPRSIGKRIRKNFGRGAAKWYAGLRPADAR